MFRDSVARYAERPAVESFGKRQTYAELGEAADAVASWLQAQGPGEGRPRRHHAAERHGLSGHPASASSSRGFTVVNVNPLYTARELAHQLKDSGARILFVLENFGHTVEEALPELDARRGRRGHARRPHGPEGRGRQPRLAAREEGREALQPAEIGAVQERRRGGPRSRRRSPPRSRSTMSPSCNTPAAPPGVAKGAILPTATSRRTSSRSRSGCATTSASGPTTSWSRRCRSTTSSRSPCAAMLHVPARRLPAPHRQSARHPGLRQDAEVATLHAHVRRQHALQRARQQPRPQGRSTSRRCACASPAAWRRRPSVAKRWKEITGRPICRGLRPLRDLAGGLRQSPRRRGVHRHDRLSGALDRRVDPRGRRRPGCRRASPANSASRVRRSWRGYWKRPDETAKVMTRRRLLPHRRHRRPAAGRAAQDRRPHQGHGPGLGLQRLSERGRGGAGRPSGRARGGGDRRAGRAFGRGWSRPTS